MKEHDPFVDIINYYFRLLPIENWQRDKKKDKRDKNKRRKGNVKCRILNKDVIKI